MDSSNKFDSKTIIENEDSSDEYAEMYKLLDEGNDFLKDVDPNLIFTSNHAFDSMVEFDSTVHVVGMVKDIESPCYKGANKDLFLFKFTIENDDNRRIQCYSWMEDATRIIPFVKLNHVIHVDGGFSRKRNPNFSKGNTAMDLTIRSNSLINVMSGKAQPVRSREIKVVPLESVCHEDCIIMVQAYVKTPFCEFDSQNSSRSYEFGCISSGKYKLEVRLQSSVDRKYFHRGDKISAIGRVQFQGNLPHLVVEDYSKMKKINEPSLPEDELLKAIIIPKRRPIMNAEDSAKKSRAE